MRVGAAFSVRATAPAAVLDRLEIAVVNGTLKIGRKRGSWYETGHDNVRIAVTLPQLTGATVAGSGDMTVDRAVAPISQARSPDRAISTSPG